jgi:hypothetical protein
MSYKRIELCVEIPGPKSPEEPLEKIEEFALERFSPAMLLALQSNGAKRLIDYLGNYFVIFPEPKKEEE